MDIQRFTFNPFETNCYVCSDDGEAVIIDPSSASDAEHEQLLRFIDASGIVVREVLLTHGHLDHIFGVARICDDLGVSYRVHRGDLSLIEGASEQGRLFGVEVDELPEAGGFLDRDSIITVGGKRLRVRHTPGHSPGSVTFVDEARTLALSGDVLFAGSIGRTDLWHGSLPVLMKSIFDELVPLGPEVRIYPGHGPETSIAQELSSNPFLTGGVEIR